MDFSLSTDHEILRDSVRSFAEKEIKPVAGNWTKKKSFPMKPCKKWQSWVFSESLFPSNTAGRPWITSYILPWRIC